MTFDRFSLYLTWGGSVGLPAQSQEIWQTGLHLARTGGNEPSRLPTPTELAAIGDRIGLFHATPPMGVYVGAVQSWVKCAMLTSDGDYAGDPVTWSPTTAVTGGIGGSTAASPQDALVVTLFSGQVLGRANYGRMYLPWNALTVNYDTGHIPTGSVDDAAAAAKTFLDDLNDLITPISSDLRVMIMSSVGTGISKRAAFVRVGNVKDTQRRRRNRIREVYASQAVAA